MNAINHFIKQILLTFIKSYQYFISPLLGNNCRHYPSCSSFAQQSVKQHGSVKGFILTFARLIRCNPWSLGGFDPVPSKVSYLKIRTFKLMGNYQTKLYNTSILNSSINKK